MPGGPADTLFRENALYDPAMQLKFASYNIRKAIGLDRRRDPERILAVLNEIGADVVALQEVDRRFGRRASALPRQMVEEHHWQVVPLAIRPDSIGWHGNALLVRKGLDILDAEPIDLPRLEPRGAVRADLGVDGRRLRVVGMHLDLSGLRRRDQVRAILSDLAACDGACPTVMLGDLNEWSRRGGCLRDLKGDWQVLSPGRSFPSRQPIAHLDRILTSPEWRCHAAGVHHSALSAQGSDHLPVWADLEAER